MVADDGTSGEELFKTDGTEANTGIVKDITPGDNSGYGPDNLVDMGGILYFTADDSAGGTNRELWHSDGTSGGTYRVKDINPSGAGVDTSSWSPEFTVVNGKLFFVADNGTAGQELWTSDGTPEGTNMVKDIRPGAMGSEPYGLYAGGTRLFFGADDGSGSGSELWVSDGTAGGYPDGKGYLSRWKFVLGAPRRALLQRRILLSSRGRRHGRGAVAQRRNGSRHLPRG